MNMLYEDLCLCFGEQNVRRISLRTCEVMWGGEVYYVSRSVFGSTVWCGKYAYYDVFALADDIKMG